MEALALEIDALQNLFYADGRHKLLVVLQGTDTSGKDGTIRGVFGQTSPLGVHTVGWKAPTEPERDHDYLWRIHQQVPAAGHIMVFNRSHYEDVLVPVVNGWITPAQTKQRYQHINDFERLLAETGTVVLKFMLHIGFDEQRERLQERVDDVTKHWKFSLGDLEVRKQWADYQKAYEACSSTPPAPLGALDRGARQFQDAPQPHDRDHRARHAARRWTCAFRPKTRPSRACASMTADPDKTTRERHTMTDLSADFKALASYRPTNKVRFVTAASLFDGHDAAINIMRRILQGMGAEVIHLGHNRSVDDVVTAALQEDVQGIAISSYQGGHVEYFKYMVDLLRAARR